MVDGTVADRRIAGWKEVASYLGVDQRTAQRWELNDGLPVLREGGKVFAYAAEVDRWRAARVVGPAVENSEAVAATAAVDAAPVPGPAATGTGQKRLARFAVFGVAGF